MSAGFPSSFIVHRKGRNVPRWDPALRGATEPEVQCWCFWGIWWLSRLEDRNNTWWCCELANWWYNVLRTYRKTRARTLQIDMCISISEREGRWCLRRKGAWERTYLVYMIGYESFLGLPQFKGNGRRKKSLSARRLWLAEFGYSDVHIVSKICRKWLLFHRHFENYGFTYNFITSTSEMVHKG
jgi:hypothetical protein